MICFLAPLPTGTCCDRPRGLAASVWAGWRCPSPSPFRRQEESPVSQYRIVRAKCSYPGEARWRKGSTGDLTGLGIISVGISPAG
jgi:hypothetical protein